MKTLAQFDLQELAGRGMRQAIDEHDVIGNLPFRNFVDRKSRSDCLVGFLPSRGCTIRSGRSCQTG
jgi:hypothetical protein